MLPGNRNGYRCFSVEKVAAPGEVRRPARRLPSHLPPLLTPLPSPRSLAPVRKSADILTRTIEAGGNSLLSGPDLAVIAGSVVAAACIMTFELIMRRDPSVSTVSAATIEALIEPARHLEPLARHLASINPLEWVFPSSGDACPGDLMRERIEALFECVRRAAISFLFIVEDHPQGRHLAAIGKIPDAPLTAAVWALAPAMNWEQGRKPHV